MTQTMTDTTEAELHQFGSLFGLLSDKTRLRIIILLAGGEKNVTSLCKDLSLPQPTVSHHLGLLRMGNLISNRRSGKQVFYTLNTGEGADNMLSLVTDAFSIKVERVTKH